MDFCSKERCHISVLANQICSCKDFHVQTIIAGLEKSNIMGIHLRHTQVVATKKKSAELNKDQSKKSRLK